MTSSSHTLRRLLETSRQTLSRTVGNQSAAMSFVNQVLRSTFVRERRAVLAGIRHYERLERHREGNRFLLRRNVHRLEKGLLMRPRRDVFALQYIEETVEAYEQLVRRREELDIDAEELRWAQDVLSEYFAVTASHPVIDAMQARFERLPVVDPPLGAPPSRPYQRDLEVPSPVSYEDFLALARRRRAVRWFRPDPVPRELIDKALIAAIEGPSACNRQPFQFRIFDDPARVAKIAEIPGGARGFAENIPTLVVLVGQLHAFFHPRDRHLIYIDTSLAAMGFMLALETVGLSSCPINWPEVPERERRMARALDLAPDERPIMLLAVGYPDAEGAVACSHKQSLKHLRTYNKP